MTNFDVDILRGLRDVREVAIRTEKRPKTAVVIWVVVADDEVFVRSVRGAKGRWYSDSSADGPATLEFAGRRLAVQAIPAMRHQARQKEIEKQFGLEAGEISEHCFWPAEGRPGIDKPVLPHERCEVRGLRGSQVRNGLCAGGRWIRTVGSSLSSVSTEAGPRRKQQQVTEIVG
jgi:hypothetical protein